MESVIYKITNLINSKFYIGSAIDKNNRFRIHKHHLIKNKHCNQHLQNAWNKYGANAFVFEAVEYVEDTNKLIDREQFYIDTLKPNYNLSPTAGSPLGVKRSEETKAKISKAQIGKKQSEESNIKRSNSLLGRKLSLENKINIGLANKGKVQTKEAKEKRSKLLKGKPLSEDHKLKMSISHQRRLAKELQLSGEPIQF